MSEEQCHCQEALDRLEEYLDAEMGSLDAGRLQEHLAECATCFDEAELEQRFRALLRRSCGERAPETLRVRVLTQITVIRTRTTGAPPA